MALPETLCTLTSVMLWLPRAGRLEGSTQSFRHAKIRTGRTPYAANENCTRRPFLTMEACGWTTALQSTIPRFFCRRRGERRLPRGEPTGRELLRRMRQTTGLSRSRTSSPDYLSTCFKEPSARKIRRSEKHSNGTGSTAAVGTTSAKIYRELRELMYESCGDLPAYGLIRGSMTFDRSERPSTRRENHRTAHEPNQDLKLKRRTDFLELAELMCVDALHREESAGRTSASNTSRQMGRP